MSETQFINKITAYKFNSNPTSIKQFLSDLNIDKSDINQILEQIKLLPNTEFKPLAIDLWQRIEKEYLQSAVELPTEKPIIEDVPESTEPAIIQSAHLTSLKSTNLGLGYIEVTENPNTGIKTRGLKRIGGYIEVLEHINNVDNSNHSGQLVKFQDRDNHIKTEFLPYTDKRINNLKSLGYPIRKTNYNDVDDFLHNAQGVTTYLEHNKAGWKDVDEGLIYISPLGSLCSENQRYTSLIKTKAYDKYQPHFSAKAWTESVYPIIQNNNLYLFAVLTSLAGCLIPLTTRHNFFIHIHGETSTGKTTALHVAASVWGSHLNDQDGVIKPWAGTSNGLINLAAKYNNSCLILDEFTEVKEQMLENMYQLINGTEKARLTSEITLRASNTWELTGLSAGEVAYLDKKRELNVKAHAGESVRFISVPFDKSDMLPEESVPILSKITEDVYGVGLDVINHLIQNYDTKEVRAKYTKHKTELREFYSSHVNQASGRVLDNLAVIALAGELLNETIGVNIQYLDVVKHVVDKLVRINYFNDLDPSKEKIDDIQTAIASLSPVLTKSEGFEYAATKKAIGFKIAEGVGDKRIWLNYLLPKQIKAQGWNNELLSQSGYTVKDVRMNRARLIQVIPVTL